jgi:hydrophobe/amphiphile efflux-1 (HAE1) family protein
MNLSEISIRRPVFAWMLMTALMIFGALCFLRLGVSQMPDVDFPVVSVSLSRIGSAPEVMETQVVDPIEDAVMEIEGIRSVTSTSRQSSANVSIEFELNRNIDIALQEVQTRIAQAQRFLPEDMNPPIIRKSNPEDQPILWMVLLSDGSMPRYQQMMYARNVLKEEFSTLSGVGDIALGGYVDMNLRVWLSAEKLNRFNITATDVINAIQNEHVETPSGRIENREKEFNVRLLGEAQNPVDFGKLLIQRRGGAPIYTPIQLNQVAKIEEGLADVRRISRSNQSHSIGLGVLKQHGSNAVNVARAVIAKMNAIQPTLPPGLKLALRVDNTRFIQQSVDELNFTLLLSALLTSIVCFLFLGSLSSTLNVLLAIPTSIIGTFIALYFFKFTLNTFTLLGLSLAIGIVVDDAIMMLENIVRHMELGENRMTAALKGSKEITFAALAATIAIVAIFIPVVFMKGIVGKFFFQYGITVTVAVLLSLLEALTLTPMRCSRYLKVGQGNRFTQGIDQLHHSLAAIYGKGLKWVLSHSWKMIVAALAFFILSIGVAFRLPSELTPAQDQSMLVLRLKGPVGSSIEHTNEKTQEVERYLAQTPEVAGTFVAVGGFGGDAVNEAMIFVTLVDPSKRKKSQQELIAHFRNDLKKRIRGMKVLAQDLSLRGFTSSRGFPIEFTVQGPDWDMLGKLTQQMMERLQQSGVAADVNTDYQVGMPEIQLIPDRLKASQYGLNLNEVTQTVNILIGGAVLNSTTRYPKDRHRYDIAVRLTSEQRTQAKQIENLKVRNNRGELITLSKVVKITEKPSLQIISRRNRERAISVHANLAPGHSQDEALQVVRAIEKEVLPQNYHIVLTGSSQSYQESLQSLIFALILGVFVSYMVLASQFNSFIDPVSVLMALPFSLSGAFIGLSLTHQSINMFSIIGLILLMGIVKKNSILLVDFTNQKMQEGLSVKDALLSACPVRLRPILMTSIATITGAIPVALSIGPGSETRIPMAVSIIGGVFVSTVLTLFIVPCVYFVLSRFQTKEATHLG